MHFDDSTNSAYVTAETIYGTHEDSNVVMSEKVQSLAGSIYQEFERMIARYDEDVVKTLMPLLVNVLECLDSAYQTNQEHEVELELLREDNEQLVTQYEREKAARKHAEQKLLETEDHYEGERKDLTGRLEALDSIVRMLELKHKNSLDHTSRLEERENELKKEYAKLHERYTELFKTHMDYMERTKLLLSTATDRGDARGRFALNPVARSSGPISFGFTSLEGSVSVMEQSESIHGSPVSMSPSPPSGNIGSELDAAKTIEKSLNEPNYDQAPSQIATNASVGKSQTKSEKRSANTLYQELAFPDTETSIHEADDGGDVTGSWVHPGDYASSVNDNYFGMGKEVENLILENNELLATKNALNIVKDDLIVKVDELTGEQEILREEVNNLSAAREKLREKVAHLEEELRNLKETMNNNTGSGDNEDESEVPMAQRRRFTRVEMARVLMERNQYKERLMELQDAVRLSELVRARVDSTMDKKSKTIWSFFSRLFSSPERPQRPLSTPHLRGVGTAAPVSALRHSRTHADFLETQLTDNHSHHRRQDKTDQCRQVRAHVRKEDGRTQAYGWSLPGKTNSEQKGASTSLSNSGVPVPVPVFCRPIAESVPKMSFLCAASLNNPEQAFTNFDYVMAESASKMLSLAAEITAQGRNIGSPEVEAAETLSPRVETPDSAAHTKENSLVWICASTQGKDLVMIIDANDPSKIIESFYVGDKHMCVACVPAASEEVSDAEKLKPEDEENQFCGGNLVGSPSKTKTGSDSEEKKFEIGSSRLVKITLLTPDTPVKVDLNNVTKLVGQEAEESFVADSPPLSSTPVNENSRHKPEAETGVDACLEESVIVTDENVTEKSFSSSQATVWFGTKSGTLYVRSAVGNYSRCIAKLKLNDAILSIAPCLSNCVVALADGTIAIFERLPNGEWDFTQYWCMTLGDPQYSVRCASAVGGAVWCGHRNRVIVVEPRTRRLLNSFVAHPHHESQVRQMVCEGEGVWVTIKMDSSLRLYHSRTYKHLADVDIEPYVSKMLGTGKVGFSFVRITALLISSRRLWIGTSNGVVISVPLMDDFGKDAADATRQGGAGHSAIVRSLSSHGGHIPSCSMAHAQLSFHGHREAVTFFVAVPGGANKAGSSLVISGGEGYIDFRTAETGMEDSLVVAKDGEPTTSSALNEKASRSHLLVWQVSTA